MAPKYLRWALFEAALNACKHPYYAERYQHTKRRLGRQRGPKVAQIELSRKLTEAIWHMLQTGETYLDPGGDYYTRRDPARTTRRLVAQLERLGHTVTLTEGAAA